MFGWAETDYAAVVGQSSPKCATVDRDHNGRRRRLTPLEGLSTLFCLIKRCGIVESGGLGRALAVVLLSLLFSLPALAWQSPPPPSPAPASSSGSSTVPPPQDSEYQVGPGDIIKIVVYGNDDLSQSILIQSDGTFLFPLIGRVKASDMTLKELERKLTTLLAHGFIRNPQVIVYLQEYRSKLIYVLGEVGHAGTFSLSDGKTVLDIAARAGIPSTAEIQIVRPLVEVQGPLLPAEVEGEGETKKAEIIRVSLRDIQAGDLSKNIPLKPNDTIFVVQAAKVYVSGEVRTPGGYSPPVNATVEQMLLLAGGFTDRASPGRIELERDVDGKSKKMKAKLADVVQPGDKIVVKSKLF
jgi:polysaccharide biosynthesis/export protein